MAFYAAQLKDMIHANRTRKAKATAAISGLGLKELRDVEGALQVTHTLAWMAERYKMTYRELSVALMESLPEEWRERVDHSSKVRGSSPPTPPSRHRGRNVPKPRETQEV